MLHHGITETRSCLICGNLTGEIIGAAIEVHSTLGPGLLESAYEKCLCRELHLRNLDFRRQVALPLEYKGVNLDCGYCMDILGVNLDCGYCMDILVADQVVLD